ncbi:alginate lyase family protein [Umboniibacter marinipuniceus]|nr:alginate lyase family protein [Umboniibacter marinipuniceus]
MLKAWQAGLPLDGSHFSSLYAQASYLSTDLEKHLLGNHYFVNLKALLFAGIIFQNSRWLGLAVTGLVKEIPEQTLPDGANFELTPMYHSLILVDMLDMFNLCRAYPSEQTSKLTLLLETYIPKMLKFMQLMSHNDGGVSFFNDSVDGIAPPKARIESYARALGFRVHKLDTMQTSAIDSMPSGYMCAMSNGNKLIFDAANVGPDYIPGHAHADTLSFELSLGPQRVFVNTGTSQYGLGEKRLVERRTQSHNTVEVDGFDSSQVWSGFRVAKRARVISRSHRVIDDRAVLSASHNGFKKVSGGPIHFRQLELSENSLKVVDAFNGEYGTAVARFYLHPSLKAAINSECLTIIGENFEIKADLKNLQAQLSDTTWHPGFGLSQPNKCLELRFTAEEQSVEFTWKTT